MSDEIANVLMARPASWHYYLTDAVFKMQVECWAPLLDQVRGELRAVPLPEAKVEASLRAILHRALEQAEQIAAADEVRRKAALASLMRGGDL